MTIVNGRLHHCTGLYNYIYSVKDATLDYKE